MDEQLEERPVENLPAIEQISYVNYAIMAAEVLRTGEIPLGLTEEAARGLALILERHRELVTEEAKLLAVQGGMRLRVKALIRGDVGAVSASGASDTTRELEDPTDLL